MIFHERVNECVNEIVKVIGQILVEDRFDAARAFPATETLIYQLIKDLLHNEMIVVRSREVEEVFLEGITKQLSQGVPRTSVSKDQTQAIVYESPIGEYLVKMLDLLDEIRQEVVGIRVGGTGQGR